MSTYTENLKLSNPFGNLQVFRKYLFQILLLLIVLVVWIPAKRIGHTQSLESLPVIMYFIFLTSMFSFGINISRIHIDFILKPFSICLPDHSRIACRSILFTGITGSLFYSALFILFYPTEINRALYFFNIFSAGLTSFILPVWYVLLIKNEYKKYITFMGVVISYIFFKRIIDGNITITFSEFIARSTIPFVILSISLFFSIYLNMAKEGFKRKYFSLKNTYSFETIDPKSASQLEEKIRIKELPEKHAEAGIIERIFFRIIKDTSYLNNTRLFMGKLYCTLDKYFTLKSWYSLISIAIKLYFVTAFLLLSGYCNSSGSYETAFEMKKHFILMPILGYLCYLVVSALTPVFHNHLLPAGRSEQLRNSITVWFIHLTVSVFWILIVILISWIMRDNMKAFDMDGLSLIYKPPGLSLLLWPVVFVPLFNIYSYRSQSPGIDALLLLLTPIMIIIDIFSFLPVDPINRTLLTALPVFIANGFFFIMVRRNWFRKDLEILN